VKHRTGYTPVEAYEWLAKCECGWMKRVGGKIDAVIAECDMHQFENGPSAADLAADFTAERDQLRAEVEREKQRADQTQADVEVGVRVASDLRAENERLRTGDLGEAYNCGEQKIMGLLEAANTRTKQLTAELAEVKEQRTYWEEAAIEMRGYKEAAERERDEAQALVGELRGKIGALLSNVTDRDINAYKALARDDGQPRDYPILVTDLALIDAYAALTTTAPQAIGRLQAKVMREMARYLRGVSGDCKEEGHHQYDLWKGLASAADDCEAEADRLEAENGR